MKTLSSLPGPFTQDLVFLLLVAQFLFAIWLSCRRHRNEPNWKTVSVLFSLLLVGLPGYLAAIAVRSGVRGFLGESGALPPQNR